MTPIVLFFQSTTDKSWRDKLEGVYRYAKNVGWQIHVIEAPSTQQVIRKALSIWQPIGCLVDRAMTLGRNPTKLFRNYPTIYLDQNPKTMTGDCSTVTNDSAACARLAAEEFLKTDVQDFTYIPYEKKVFWCDEREAAFSAAVRKSGRNYHKWNGSLSNLPRPCGILCAEDPVARRAINEAIRQGFDIPNDLLFIGIDNDLLICERTNPTLTSVLPGFELAGFKLAELLDQRIKNPHAPPQHLTYEPVGLIRRESSRLLVKNDARVRKALSFIRENATQQGLSTADVAAVMGCSRSLADLRFRESVGHSIHAEINNLRLEHAYELLRKPNQSIAPIANFCGYASDAFFKRMFKAATGMTMREWRKRQTATQTAL